MQQSTTSTLNPIDLKNFTPDAFIPQTPNTPITPPKKFFDAPKIPNTKATVGNGFNAYPGKTASYITSSIG